MIEINLLPPELRKKKTLHVEVEQIVSPKVLLTFLGCFVLAHTVILTASFISAKRLEIIKTNWNGLSPQRARITQLNTDYADIQQKVLLIEKLIGERILWTRKLNLLSELLVNGVWLNQLSIDTRIEGKKEKPAYVCLTIRGSAASRAKNEPALIGKFMQNLKGSPEFAADFAEIELGPIRQRQITQTTIMDFVLTAQFTPEKISALSQ